MSFTSTKIIELGSCAFRQPAATSHCKFLHGYRLTAKFWFSADQLDDNNWVVDFGGLKELKSFLQDDFDHTTCISKDDPALDEFKRLRNAGVLDLKIMDGVGIEKFAEHCYNVANSYIHQYTSGRCRCVKVEVFEHENNSAIFEMEEEKETKKKVKVAKKKEPKPKVEKKEDSTITQPPFKPQVKDASWKREDTPLKGKKKSMWLTGETTWGL